MTKVILTTAHTPIAPAAGSTRYWKVGIGALFNTVTEALSQVPFRSAGTFSKLYVRVTANTASATSTVTLRKNAADTGISLSIAAGATGAFENNNTETISAGDLINYKTVSAGTGVVTFSIMSIIFDATTNCVSKLLTETYTLTIAAGRFTPHVGDISSVSSSGTTQNLTIKKAVTIKNLAVYVPSNARTTNTSVILRKNSVDQTALVTFGNVETGLKEDTTHPITTAANDINDYKMTTGAGTETITLQFHAIEVEHATHGFISASAVGAAADQTQNSGLTRYVPISGSTKTHTVEANTQQKARHAFVFSELMFRTTINTLDGNTTLTLRKNGVDTALTCTIGATIGVVGDSTNAVTVEPEDLINYKVLTTGTTGNVQLKHLAVWAEPITTIITTPIGSAGRSQGRSPLYRTVKPKAVAVIITLKVQLEYEVTKLTIIVGLAYIFEKPQIKIKFGSAIITPILNILPLRQRPTPKPVIRTITTQVPYQVQSIELKSACGYQVDKLITRKQQSKLRTIATNFLLSDADV